MHASNWLENRILDDYFGNSAFAATLYVALFTAAPNDAGGGTEVAGGSYARAAVTNNATNFPAAANGQKSNANAINFAQATNAWGTVTHAGIFDALSGGNMLLWMPLDASKTVASGDTVSITAGSLILQCD